MPLRYLKLLKSLGEKLPTLTDKEWHTIFGFFDYFLTTHDEIDPKNPQVNWKKLKEILILLEKVKEE